MSEPASPTSRRQRRDLAAVGTDPDYRYSFANERTFLAWIRTSLALVAAGVASALVLWRRRATLTEAASVSRTARQLRDVAVMSALVGVVGLAVVGLGLVD